MISIKHRSEEIEENGFTIIPSIYSNEELIRLIYTIDSADTRNFAFRKSTELFAIRQFFKEIPKIEAIIFNHTLKKLVNELFGENYFVVKSIYFDKPESSNWFVPYHQDLTISVDKKTELEGYGPWTVKQNQFSVQPPIAILQNIFTIRIHLDDTDEFNGALKVINSSHKRGIFRPETIDWSIDKETTCCLQKGGIMIMKPLLLHSSSRTTNNKRRRVIHIEFSNLQLTKELNWAEK